MSSCPPHSDKYPADRCKTMMMMMMMMIFFFCNGNCLSTGGGLSVDEREGKSQGQ